MFIETRNKPSSKLLIEQMKRAECKLLGRQGYRVVERNMTRTGFSSTAFSIYSDGHLTLQSARADFERLRGPK